jgi:hypothetical protein
MVLRLELVVLAVAVQVAQTQEVLVLLELLTQAVVVAGRKALLMLAVLAVQA